jgi:glyoxylase-like metal-dependent hydrolase (beta-lactamase superfamily II)
MGVEETRHARREYLQQASEVDVLRNAWNPRVMAWSLRILPLGATKDVRLADPVGVEAGPALDVPGRPVAVPTPGHTDGHTAWHFPSAGCVATGDALVTGHPVTGIHHPHLLPGFFTHDQAQAEASLDAIAALDAERLLPGHGLTWSGPASRAVELAREHHTG